VILIPSAHLECELSGDHSLEGGGASDLDGRAETGVSARQWSRAVTGAATIGLAGCSDAPAQNILGSFFPSWMLCVLAGLGAAILVRQGLAVVGIDKTLPAPLLVYLAFTVFFAFAVWLAWQG
jgi:YtcA family